MNEDRSELDSPRGEIERGEGVYHVLFHLN